jgi:HSP20 family protein
MPEKTNAALAIENAQAKRDGRESEITRNTDHCAAPLVDIYETHEALIVVSDLPGVSRESLEIRVEENVLTIEGKMTHTFKENPTFHEIEPMNFFRQFTLAGAVDAEKITAELNNGVLTLTLPWKKKMQPRQVKINVS